MALPAVTGRGGAAAFSFYSSDDACAPLRMLHGNFIDLKEIQVQRAIAPTCPMLLEAVRTMRCLP